MLDNWAKIATIAAAIVIIMTAIVGPTIAGIFWLAMLDNDVRQLQTDVAQMKLDIEQIQDNQQIIIEILRELSADVQKSEADLIGHTHDADGRTRLPLNLR